MRSVGCSAPLHPLGDGMREGSHPLALSRGCSVGGFGFRRDRRAANFSLRHFCFCGGLHENFVPDRTGARRVALIGAFASAAMQTKISFPTARSVGRSAPLHPLGDGVREGSHPLALSRGCSTGKVSFRRDRRAAHTFRGCSSAASDFEKMPVAFLWERKRVNRIFSHRDSGAASLSRGTHSQRSSGGRDASEAHTLSRRRTGNL